MKTFDRESHAGLNHALSQDSEENVVYGPEALHLRRARIRMQQAEVASARSTWIRRNSYFYKQVTELLQFLIEPNCRVLNIHSQTGYLMNAVKPSYGLGVDVSEEMVDVARAENPRYEYTQAFPENLETDRKFDYILYSNIGETVDLFASFRRLKNFSEKQTRLVIYSYNHLWEPLVKLAARLKMKVPQPELNWLSDGDVSNLLELSGFEVLKIHRKILMPFYIPLFSSFLNDFVANLPFLNRLCFIQGIVARPKLEKVDPSSVSVSIIIPCKNERGNVEAAVRRIPALGRHTEIIFCDDKSTDGTAEEVVRMQKLFPEKDIKLVAGPGICKSENVWTGFNAAQGDVLMILDADLTVMPEELPMFFKTLVEGSADFVNGSRLVYPIPRNAMNLPNMLGNKAFSLVFSYLLNQRIKDTLCGTKVIWRRDWTRIKRYLNTWGIHDRWGDYELLLSAAKLNLKIVDLPVHYQERIYGTTKMVNVFYNGLRMLRICIAAAFKLKFGFSRIV